MVEPELDPDLDRLIEMMARPLDEMADDEVQRILYARLKNCITELESTRNRENRRNAVGRALKSMFVLGRWSIMN